MIRDPAQREPTLMNPEDSTSTPYISPQGGDAWAQDAATQGKTGTQRLIAVDNSPPDQNVRAALELPDGENVIIRRRLILANEQPVELADSYYPASIAADTALAENKRIKGGAVQALADAGFDFADVRETITARPATTEEQEQLQVDNRESIIVLTRVSRAASGRPIECAINRMVASRIEPLRYRVKASNQ